MKDLLVALSLIFSFSIVSAESFYDAKIILTTGGELHGLATLPGNPGPSMLRFKESKDAKSHYVRSDTIKTVIYDVGVKTLEYDVMNVYTTPSHKTIQQWFLQVQKRGYVTLYTYVDLDVIMAGDGGNLNSFNGNWACARPGEAIATTISGSERKNKHGVFTVAAADYFKDDPALVAKINGDQYKWNDMVKIVEEYNQDRH
jgi:hypothetical protein